MSAEQKFAPTMDELNSPLATHLSDSMLIKVMTLKVILA